MCIGGLQLHQTVSGYHRLGRVEHMGDGDGGGLYYDLGLGVVEIAIFGTALWLGWVAAHAVPNRKWEWPAGIVVFLLVLFLGFWLAP